MPPNFLIENLQCVPAMVVRGLQSSDGLEEHAQRLGGIRPAVHVPLLLAVVGLREQPTYQLDEHRHCIVRELLAELDKLRHDQGVSTAGIEVVGQPCRCGVALTDHLIPSSDDMRACNFGSISSVRRKAIRSVSPTRFDALGASGADRSQ